MSYFFGKGNEIEFKNFSLAHLTPILIALAVILLLAKYGHKIRDTKLDKPLRYFLAFSLVISDMSYYWRLVGLADELQPNAIDHLPITVCGEHTLGYIAIFYMIFVHKMRPTVKSAVKSYLAFVAMGAIAFFANRILGPGANYLFMAKPEDTPSILDILPPNFALRLLIMASIVTLMYFISYLPWMIKDIKAKKRNSQQIQEETAMI